MKAFLLAEGIRKSDLEREYQFCPVRRWRADFHVKRCHVLVEVEGGIGYGRRSRHTEPSGFVKDASKYNAAVALGYKVFRTASQPTPMRKTAALVGKIYRGEFIDDDFLKEI